MSMDEEKQPLLKSPSSLETQQLRSQQGNEKPSVQEVDDFLFVRVPNTGLRQICGISSSYSLEYPSQLIGVIDADEYVDIIKRLNHTIRDFWPCNVVYFFGYGCSLCSCGISLLFPHYCISYSEQKANEMLRHVSLKSKFYDRNITFSMRKGICSSYVEIKIPSQLTRITSSSNDVPTKSNSDIIQEEDVEKGILYVSESTSRNSPNSPWSVVMTSQPTSRLKDL
jgi:hypothetical protein